VGVPGEPQRAFHQLKRWALSGAWHACASWLEMHTVPPALYSLPLKRHGLSVLIDDAVAVDCRGDGGSCGIDFSEVDCFGLESCAPATAAAHAMGTVKATRTDAN
jgi:hypothetical protein